LIQLAWRFLRFHPNRELAQWYKKRAVDGRSSIRKTMIVALARKLLIVLWRMVATGEPPHDVHLLGRIFGVGVETADVLANEILSRNLRDRRAVSERSSRSHGG
jgi:hypothetical protein